MQAEGCSQKREGVGRFADSETPRGRNENIQAVGVTSGSLFSCLKSVPHPFLHPGKFVVKLRSMPAAYARSSLRFLTAADRHGSVKQFLHNCVQMLYSGRFEERKNTFRDMERMDMYVRAYDCLKRLDGDNTTFGVVLCSVAGETAVKYSVPQGADGQIMSR